MANVTQAVEIEAPQRPDRGAARAARARLPARDQPAERALPDRLHGLQRRVRGGARRALFLTDFRYVEQSAAQVRGFERVTAGRDMLDDLAGRLRGRTGFDDSHMTVASTASWQARSRTGSSWCPRAGWWRTEGCQGRRRGGRDARGRGDLDRRVRVAARARARREQRARGGARARALHGGPRCRRAVVRADRGCRRARRAPTRSRATSRSRATRSWWSTWARSWTATARTARGPSPPGP